MESLDRLDVRDTFANSVYTEEDMREAAEAGAPEMVLDSPPPVHPVSSQHEQQQQQEAKGLPPPARTQRVPRHDGFSEDFGSEDFDNLSPDYLPPPQPTTSDSQPPMPTWQSPPPDSQPPPPMIPSPLPGGGDLQPQSHLPPPPSVSSSNQDIRDSWSSQNSHALAAPYLAPREGTRASDAGSHVSYDTDDEPHVIFF